MLNQPIMDNVDLILDCPKKPDEIALFIVSNTYYFLRSICKCKTDCLDEENIDFSKYLSQFKQKFKKMEIEENFSFNLMNLENESKFYTLKLNNFINIMNLKIPSLKENLIINSIISRRNCLIYLEYLYLLIKNNPKVVSHYIIKIHISFLAFIVEEINTRLINDDEYFYLNLLELKENFERVEYHNSNSIADFDLDCLFKLENHISLMKQMKLTRLKKGLIRIKNYMIKQPSNNNNSTFIDYIDNLYKKLTKDIESNKNYDQIINEYIINANKHPKKDLKKIIDDINKTGEVPEFNYLYIMALNSVCEPSINDDSLIPVVNNPNVNCDISNSDQKKDLKTEEKQICVQEKDNSWYESLDENIQNLIEKEGLIKKINIIDDDENISNLKKDYIPEENDLIKKYINKYFLYDKILNVDRKNIFDVLIFLQTYPKDESYYIDQNYDKKYIEYKNKLIEKLKDLNRLDSDSFYEIISDDAFHQEIIEILNSEPVKNYLLNNRDFKELRTPVENGEKFDFRFCNDNEEFTENLSKEFCKFYEKIKEKLFFVDLFRLKYLPTNIRALVDSNLKIVINSLHYDFNENISRSNKKIILKAVFKILILHEIIHILKYLKPGANYNNIPKTPRGREGGKMFINYLFNKPIITRISLEQANAINDMDNWKDLNKLRNIFPKSEKSSSQSNNKEMQSKNFINLYLSLEEDLVIGEEDKSIYEHLDIHSKIIAKQQQIYFISL